VEDDCELLPVEEINYQKEIALFPNPAKKQVTIKAPKEVIFDDVVFYTQTGQKVLHGKPVNNNVDISKLPPGMYVVELGSGAWKVRKKLMVE
jgi:hypothetical protein